MKKGKRYAHIHLILTDILVFMLSKIYEYRMRAVEMIVKGCLLLDLVYTRFVWKLMVAFAFASLSGHKFPTSLRSRSYPIRKRIFSSESACRYI